MPPSKSRQAPPPPPCDSEGSSTKEKHSNPTNSTNGKSRRVAANGANAGNSLQNIANSNTTAASNVVLGNDNMEWSEIESSTLQIYRHAYQLNTPSAFCNPHDELVLSRGMGKLSPMMARRKDRRRQSKEQLTHAVRKHFNGLGIQENQVVVDFLYKVHNMDKNFRMLFAPPSSR